MFSEFLEEAGVKMSLVLHAARATLISFPGPFDASRSPSGRLFDFNFGRVPPPICALEVLLTRSELLKPGALRSCGPAGVWPLNATLDGWTQ